jgi:hypothetical protein
MHTESSKMYFQFQLEVVDRDMSDPGTHQSSAESIYLYFLSL